MNKDRSRIRNLLEAKSRLLKKLKELDEKFKEIDKELEDAWPGHGENVLQQLEEDRQLILAQLGEIEKAIKDLKR